MPFGKFEGQSIAIVVSNDPRYVAWLLTLPPSFWAQHPDAHRELRRRFAEHLLYWLDEEDRQQERAERRTALRDQLVDRRESCADLV